MNTALAELTNLSADELRAMVSGLMQKVASNAAVINANEVQISRPCKIQFKPSPSDDLSFAADYGR
jgi:hypothetical protein